VRGPPLDQLVDARGGGPHDGAMGLKAPIGISDFRKLREQGAYYVDKTALLVEFLSMPTEVTLWTRPRRFGKTLNLSTLRYFLEKSNEDRSALFADLAVWKSDEARQHFGRYPVVSLSFKDVKATTFDEALADIQQIIGEAVDKHRYLVDDGSLSGRAAEVFEALVRGEATPAQYGAALRTLSKQLAAHHGERVVLLIDEYDTPIHAGYTHGYYDKIIGFFRKFLSGGLKDNEHLFRGALTGILRVAKESLFSGLNNIDVHGLLSPKYAADFGFTDDEVAAIASAMGDPSRLNDIRHWYDGYRVFGDTAIYNPWSVLKFAALPEAGLQSYWVQTSSDDVLRGLVLEKAYAVEPEFETLLMGGTLTKRIDDHIVLRDLHTNPESIWSFLLHSGYLTAKQWQLEQADRIVELAIPNEEVRHAFKASVRSWLESGLHGSGSVHELWKAMLDGNDELFQELLSTLVVRTFSFHDTVRQELERVYQSFLLGLLIDLPDHQVRSNREVGVGRADVLVLPRKAGLPGVVFELKRMRKHESVDDALDTALEQIKQKNYADELRAAGASAIHAYGIVFDGKRVLVRRAQ